MHRDHLGSPELITNAAGAVVVRLSFGAYGERRDSDWDGAVSSADMTAIGNTTRRGFTGHEHLDSVNLIHMNGRVYEPIIGRMLSPDAVVQVGAAQSVNCYAYVWNNPLTRTDPSGWKTKTAPPPQPPPPPPPPPEPGVPPFVEVIASRIQEATKFGMQSVAYLATMFAAGRQGLGRVQPEEIPERSAGFDGSPGGGAAGGSTQAPQGEKKDKCAGPKNESTKSLAARVGENWLDTNKDVWGALAPPGVSMITAGATSEAWLGTRSATIGRWVLSGFRPITVGTAAFPAGESAILVGASGTMNFSVSGLSYEGGVLIGSTISALPGPGSSDSIRDWLAGKLMETLGPKLTIPELECGW